MEMDTGIGITYRGALQLGVFLGLLIALALDRVLNRGRNQELHRLYDQEEVTEEEVMRVLEDPEVTREEIYQKETNNKNYENNM